MQVNKKINCGQCTYCCEVTTVFLIDENPDDYLTDEIEGLHVLQHKKNGDCVYLDNGCTIYKSRPLMCETYHCIDFYNKGKNNPKFQIIMENKRFITVVKAAIRRNQ